MLIVHGLAKAVLPLRGIDVAAPGVLTPSVTAMYVIIRSTISNERIPAWAAALNLTAFELPHFIMQRRMMLGIKKRAERTAEDQVSRRY